MRADFYDIYYDQPGRNTLDVCFMAFFRNMEEAEAYVYDYIGVDNPDDTTEETTEEPTEETTEAPAGTTEAPAGTTAAPEDEKPTGTSAPSTDDDKAGGCGSVVGLGTVAIVTVAAVAGFVSFKKKKD